MTQQALFCSREQTSFYAFKKFTTTRLNFLLSIVAYLMSSYISGRLARSKYLDGFRAGPD